MGIVRVAVRCVGALRVAALAALAACGGPGAIHPRPPDCRIEVFPNPPGENYVQVGEMDFGAYVIHKQQYQYKSPYTLAADMRDQICAAGGDTLVAERDASGVIVHATVYRHANDSDIPAPYPKQRPPKAESCEGGCGPGFACERDVCVPQAPACEPACGDGETCGADRLCHPADG
jgi:hypothetical protein